jgi:hypothetical protein
LPTAVERGYVYNLARFGFRRHRFEDDVEEPLKRAEELLKLVKTASHDIDGEARLSLLKLAEFHHEKMELARRYGFDAVVEMSRQQREEEERAGRAQEVDEQFIRNLGSEVMRKLHLADSRDAAKSVISRALEEVLREKENDSDLR